MGGNIIAAHPISDLNAICMAAGASYTLVSKSKGSRTVAPHDFITGCRQAFWLNHGERICIQKVCSLGMYQVPLY